MRSNQRAGYAIERAAHLKDIDFADCLPYSFSDTWKSYGEGRTEYGNGTKESGSKSGDGLCKDLPLRMHHNKIISSRTQALFRIVSVPGHRMNSG